MNHLQSLLNGGRVHKPQITIFDMVTMVKCLVCEIEFQDDHPSRKGNKFCCREHFIKYKKIHGCGNKGKKWNETYSEETLKFMKERISKKGKEHFNYGKKRVDVLMRNLLSNPNKTKEYKEKLQIMFKENPNKTIDFLIKQMLPNKVYAYQRIAYETYGKICSKCGETEGQIDVHHKDENRKNNKIINLMVFCAPCHAKFHKTKKEIF